MTQKQKDLFILGEIEAFQKLGTSAIDYAHEIVAAENAGTPVGSPSVTGAIGDLRHAAVGYALMMIFSEKLLSVEEIQRIDDALTDRLNEDAARLNEEAPP